MNSYGRRLDQLERVWPGPALSPGRQAAIIAEVARRHGLDADELMARVENDGGPAPLPPLPPGATREQVIAQIAAAYGLDPAELAASMDDG